jgi:hypothetical protein
MNTTTDLSIIKKDNISNVADLMSVTHISSLLLHGRGKIMQVEMSG